MESIATDQQLRLLFHQLNNQLGVVLAHAELLEAKSPDVTHRARAEQVVKSVLEALGTAKRSGVVLSHSSARKSRRETFTASFYEACFNQALHPTSVIRIVNKLAKSAAQSADPLTICTALRKRTPPGRIHRKYR